MHTLKADVIVVGSGPGGATVARELAKAGKKVIILERGIDYRSKFYYGSYLGALIYSDKMSMLFTKEGLNIIRPLMVGGATSMFCGCAAPPPDWLKQKYKIDIDDEVNDTIRELDIKPLPEELRGKASTKIANAAKSLGYDWFPQPKFMKTSGTKSLDCGAKCMLGCRCGAKWNAAEYIDEAVESGAILYTGSYVKQLLFENRHVRGVKGKLNGKPFEAYAEKVVLAAGGIGTPRILQRSGLKDAGIGITMDTTVMLYGFTKEKGIGNEPPMTWSWENPADGYMLSTLIDPWLLYPLVAIRKGLKPALRWHKWDKSLGVMIKLKDEISGGIFPDGKISKPLTKNDQEKLSEASKVCEKILIEAGARQSTIFMTPLRGTHPSSTVRIGTMLDDNLQTEKEGLYVCDASVFPEALDRPTVLTIIGLGKRLAKHLSNV